MAITNIQERPAIAPGVHTLLGGLKRRIRQYVWLQGSAAALAWLGVAFWLTLAGDWFFEPPPAVRIVALAAVAVVLVVVVFRMIVRRAFVRISDSNAATVLERRFAKLNDSLLTAVVLTGRETSEAEVSPQMLAYTCREAAARIGEVDLRRVFNPRPLWLHSTAAVSLLLSVVFFAALFPEAFGVWARRALALSDELWPRKTRLEIDGFPDKTRKVARGSDLELVVRADAGMPRVPESVQIRYRMDGGGHGRVTMDRRGMVSDKRGQFQEYSHPFRSILSDVHFDVFGGDDRLRDLWIQAVDSPKISRDDMTIECQWPPYIGRQPPPQRVAGVMPVPMGSMVTVVARNANKELVRIDVHTIVGDQPGPATVLSENQLSPDRRGFTHRLGPLMKDTTLLLTLSDTDGITSREPEGLVLVPTPDQPPQLGVQLDGIDRAVTPQARIPVGGQITDDYGIGRVWFEHAIDDGTPGTRPIAQLPKAPPVYPLTTAALDVRELGAKPGQKLLLAVKASDLCDLGHGSNVASSERWLLDVVTPEQLRAMLEAREFLLRQRFERMIQEMTETRDLLAHLRFDIAKSPLPLGEGKGVAKSPLPPGESKGEDGSAKQAKANDKHADSRGPHPNPLSKGAAAAKKPDDAVKKPSTEKKLAHGDEPGDEESEDSAGREHTLRSLRVQGALTNCRKSTQEVIGLADAFDDICKQLVNNRIDTEELRNRLQGGIAQPLRSVADKMFPELERRLDRLHNALDDVAKGPRLRDAAQQQADDILLAMRKVLDRMIELEDFNELVALLQGIIKAQDELRTETQQWHKKKIQTLLKE